MIVKKFIYKNGKIFKRVKYNPESFLCSQYECKYSKKGIRGNNVVCDLCLIIRKKFCFRINLYIPTK